MSARMKMRSKAPLSNIPKKELKKKLQKNTSYKSNAYEDETEK